MDSIKEAIRTYNDVTLYEKADMDRIAKDFAKRSKNVFKKWDVYWAGVQFKDDPRYYKIRPIVIIDSDNRESVNALYCTTVFKKDRYQIKDWLNLGFSEPTYVIYNHKESVPIKYVFESANKSLSKDDRKQLGNLSIDIEIAKNQKLSRYVESFKEKRLSADKLLSNMHYSMSMTLRDALDRCKKMLGDDYDEYSFLDAAGSIRLNELPYSGYINEDGITVIHGSEETY